MISNDPRNKLISLKASQPQRIPVCGDSGDKIGFGQYTRRLQLWKKALQSIISTWNCASFFGDQQTRSVGSLSQRTRLSWGPAYWQLALIELRTIPHVHWPLSACLQLLKYIQSVAWSSQTMYSHGNPGQVNLLINHKCVIFPCLAYWNKKWGRPQRVMPKNDNSWHRSLWPRHKKSAAIEMKSKDNILVEYGTLNLRGPRFILSSSLFFLNPKLTLDCLVQNFLLRLCRARLDPMNIPDLC
jgi:hypothetical protein